MRTRPINVSAVFLVMASAISISPLINVIGVVKGSLFSLISLCAIYLVKLKILSRANISEKLKFSKQALFGIATIVTVSTINSFYWNELTLKVTVYFCSAFFIIFFLEKKDLSDYAEYMSKILIVLLIGAFVGFLWAKIGGDAIFTITNEDGRPNGLYLTTLSNTYFQGIIRPSGFFDEPGALSFYICMTVAMREKFGMNRNYSWILLILGLITTSLAHVIFMAVYWVSTELVTFKRTITSIVVVVLTLLLLTTFDNPIGDLIILTFDRFQVVDGVLAGDNRSSLMLNAINYLDINTFFFGHDGDCILNSEACALKNYDLYGENPLTLLVYWGIFLSLPYYLVQGYLLTYSVVNKNLLAFGVFIVLLQRPNVMSYGYSVIIMAYVYAIASKKIHQQSLMDGKG